MLYPRILALSLAAAIWTRCESFAGRLRTAMAKAGLDADSISWPTEQGTINLDLNR